MYQSKNLPEFARPAIIEALRDFSEPLTPEDFYGVKDYEARIHLYDCSVTIPDNATVVEAYMTEFNDTDNDPLELHYLIARGLSCDCGKMSNLDMGRSGTLFDMVRMLMKHGAKF